MLPRFNPPSNRGVAAQRAALLCARQLLRLLQSKPIGSEKAQPGGVGWARWLEQRGFRWLERLCVDDDARVSATAFEVAASLVPEAGLVTLSGTRGVTDEGSSTARHTHQWVCSLVGVAARCACDTERTHTYLVRSAALSLLDALCAKAVAEAPWADLHNIESGETGARGVAKDGTGGGMVTLPELSVADGFSGGGASATISSASSRWRQQLWEEMFAIGLPQSLPGMLSEEAASPHFQVTVVDPAVQSSRVSCNLNQLPYS